MRHVLFENREVGKRPRSLHCCTGGETVKRHCLLLPGGKTTGFNDAEARRPAL